MAKTIPYDRQLAKAKRKLSKFEKISMPRKTASPVNIHLPKGIRSIRPIF